MWSYAEDREQTSILMTFSTVSIGTTGISRSREMFTRLVDAMSGKFAIRSSALNNEQTTGVSLNQHQLDT